MSEINQQQNSQPTSGTARKKTVAGIITDIILYCVLAVLIVIVLSMGYSTLIEKSPVPKVFGTAYLTVMSDSMSPIINKGDIVVVRPSDDYKVGDVITFVSDGETATVTHRIIRIEGDKYYTQGDDVEVPDKDPVTRQQIVGKVVDVWDDVGIFIQWLRTPEGFVLAFVAVALVVLLFVALKMKF